MSNSILTTTCGKVIKDYRTKVLKPIFDEHGPSDAPQHKPDFIEEQDWTFLCELWSSKKHEVNFKINGNL